MVICYRRSRKRIISGPPESWLLVGPNRDPTEKPGLSVLSQVRLFEGNPGFLLLDGHLSSYLSLAFPTSQELPRAGKQVKEQSSGSVMGRGGPGGSLPASWASVEVSGATDLELTHRDDHEDWGYYGHPQLKGEEMCGISRIRCCRWNTVGAQNYETNERMNACKLRMHGVCPG